MQRGQVHMLLSNEDPYNEDSVVTFNEYCEDYKMGFDVVNSKYSFKTDFKYFDLSEEWVEWFDKTKASFEKTKENFINTGRLIDSYDNPVQEFARIGGEPDWIQTDETPNDPDGNAMTFIAQVDSGNFADPFACDKYIYLFYSHNHKLAVLIYQVT